MLLAMLLGAWLCAFSLLAILETANLLATPIGFLIDMVTFFPLMFVSLLAPTILAVSSVNFALKRTWHYSIVAAIVPVALLVAPSLFFGSAQGPFGVAYLPIDIGDRLRFLALKPTYDLQIAGERWRPRIQVFAWEIDIEGWKGVVYDDTDEVILPPNQRSASWAAGVWTSNLTDLNDPCWVERLWSHYYMVGGGC
jgi:hypothetical protein